MTDATVPPAATRMIDAEPSVFAAIVALLLAALFHEVTGEQTLIQLGRFDLSIADPAFALAYAAAVHSWIAGRPRLNAATVPAMLLAALVCVSLVRGAAQDAFVAFFWLRATGFLMPFVLIGATLRPGPVFCRWLRAAIVATGVALALLVMLRTAFGTSLFFTIDVDNPLEINDGDRAISNIGAIVVAMALILAVGAVIRPVRAINPVDPVLAVLLSGALLLSGQATAILGALAALLALVVIERPFRERSVVGLGAVGLAGAVYATAATWIDLLPLGLRDTLAHRSSNLGTREAVWSSFWARFETQPLLDKLIGMPAGQDHGLVVFISGQWRLWLYSLHSMYVALVSTEGLLGLAAYLAFLGATLVIAAFLARTPFRLGPFTPALAIAFVILGIVESYSYELQQERLLLMLVPMLVVAQAQRKGARPRPAGAVAADRTARA